MADIVLQTNEACLAQATAEATRLEGSFIRLFQAGLEVDQTTTAVQLEAEECDFSGYPAGGIEIEEFLAPILASEGGYSIQSPIAQFATASPTTVPNTIGGWWLETATGDVVMVVMLDVTNRVPMSAPGQGYPVSARRVFPNA